MIPFNHNRDASDIGIGKEQQTAGDDDGYWRLGLTHQPKRSHRKIQDRLSIISSRVHGEWLIFPLLLWSSSQFKHVEGMNVAASGQENNQG